MLYNLAQKAKENNFTQIQSDVSILDELFSLPGKNEQNADLEELSRYFQIRYNEGKMEKILFDETNVNTKKNPTNCRKQ